jgi:hypothetical protein
MAVDRERLEELILLGKLDELFSLVTLEDIADAWCRYQSRPHIYEVDEEDPDEWAMLFVAGGRFDDLDEPLVRTLLDILIDRAPSDDVLEQIGAGPLEDFTKGCDEDRLSWIEERAASSTRFRHALARVWIWSIEPEAFARVERAAGVPLTRPDEDVILDIVPGDLPGTIHITRNGVTVSEIETEPDRVEGMIEFLKQHPSIRRTF